jgi:hypothetical protein
MAGKRPKRDGDGKERLTPGRLPAFIRGCILQGYVKIELRHLTEDGSSRVDRWPLKGEEDEPVSAESLNYEIMSVAEADAEGWGGHQRYAVCAYDGAETRTYAKRAIFEIRADGVASDDDGPTESATQKGFMAQMMRHLEMRDRTFASAIGDIVSGYQEMVGRQQKRLELLENKQFEVLSLFEELASARHVRELEQMKEIRIDRIQTKVTNELLGYLPVVAKKFLGTGNGASIAAEDKLSALLASFEPHQLAILKGILKTHQLAILKELQESYGKNADKKKRPPAYVGEELVHKLLDSLDQEQQMIIIKNLSPEQVSALQELAETYGKRNEAKEVQIKKEEQQARGNGRVS